MTPLYAIWSDVRNSYLYRLADPAVFKDLQFAKHVLGLQNKRTKSRIVRLVPEEFRERPIPKKKPKGTA